MECNWVTYTHKNTFIRLSLQSIAIEKGHSLATTSVTRINKSRFVNEWSAYPSDKSTSFQPPSPWIKIECYENMLLADKSYIMAAINILTFPVKIRISNHVRHFGLSCCVWYQWNFIFITSRHTHRIMVVCYVPKYTYSLNENR